MPPLDVDPQSATALAASLLTSASLQMAVVQFVLPSYGVDVADIISVAVNATRVVVLQDTIFAVQTLATVQVWIL